MAYNYEYPYYDSNMHNDDWLLSEMKRLADEWITYNNNWDKWQQDLNAAFIDLKKYVNDYFTNLDIPKEISDKIDKMASDGTLLQIMSNTIITTTSNWLKANITEPTGVVIDKSLSIDGAAADAKATGDAIGNLKNKVFLLCLNYVEINRTSRTVKIAKNTRLFNKTYNYLLPDDVVLDFIPSSSTPINMITVNTSTNEIENRKYYETMSKDVAIIFMFSNDVPAKTPMSIDISVPYVLDGQLFGAPSYQYGGIDYVGEKMNAVHSLNFENMFSITYPGTKTLNDIDVYNNYIVCAINPDELRIINANNGETYKSYTVDVNHGATMQISKTLNDGDLIPNVYSGNDSTINVIQVRDDAATVIKKIKFKDCGHSANFVIDFDAGVLYGIGYNEETFRYTDTNYCIFNSYNLNDLTEEDGVYIPALLSTKKIPYIGVLQGKYFYAGRLYIAIADINAPHNPIIIAVDCESGSIVSKVDCTAITGNVELEGLCKSGNDLIVTGYFDFYKLRT